MKKEPKIKQKSTNQENGFGFFELVSKLLSNLPKRSQEIVKKRFGMFDEKGYTLDKIGKEYRITRERVRQIIVDSIKKVAKKIEEADFKKAEDYIIFTIQENNGIINKEEALKKMSGGNWKEANAIDFVIFSSGKIKDLEEKNLINKSLALSEEVIEKARKIYSIAKEIFEKHGKTLTDQEVSEKMEKAVVGFSKGEVFSYLDVLSGIVKNNFGKWGLVDWEEITPKGTREKIYLVLKEKGNPMHFTEIAKAIDEYGLSKKKSHPQTVHNELIKDERFVLIGRGIYALKEWGYAQGTVKEVLEEILKKKGGFSDREEILDQILKVRKVKKSTVMINLNNSNYFVREKNLYYIKK